MQPTTPDDEPQSVTLTPAEALKVLDQGEMETVHGLMRYSSNYTYLVTMRLDELCANAIYKPQRGERPLWDFPDATLCYRERASFITAELLGWQFIPPTVLREGKRGLGSIQLYIEHDPDRHYFTFEGHHAPQLARIQLFDALVNNADRKGGHMLLDEQDKVWCIDQGLTFNEDHKLRTVVWDFAGQPIPEPLVADVERLEVAVKDTQSAYRLQLDALLTPRETQAFTSRIEQLLRKPYYPMPGAGPNYPWPAV
jgi:hypothetical protein